MESWDEINVKSHVQTLIPSHDTISWYDYAWSNAYLVSEKIEDNVISTGYVKTREKLGDIFTKALNGARVKYLFNKLSMINIYAPTWGRVLQNVHSDIYL